MTRHAAIEPGATVGVLGGGQLGAMFAQAARRLGYRVAAWDPDPEAPALRGADLAVSAPFADAAPLAEFARVISAATYEWENVPVALAEALERHVPVRPASRILRILQNRLEQKTFLARHGFPVAPFHAISSPEELVVPESIGFPSLCKTATTGYDGKGQWRLSGPADVCLVREQLRRGDAPSPQPSPPTGGRGEGEGGLSGARRHDRWIVEQLLPFEKELSVLVVRTADGDRRLYPVVENLHEGGILRVTRAPAQIDAGVGERAAGLAGAVVEALDGVGVFCVELFLMPGGRLFVNEVAPRPHNSGHYTLDACTVSQFEQQVRAVCGLPLGEARLLSPAVMVNLIGDDFYRVTAGDGLTHLMGTPGSKLHLYGKASVRPGRKMGHVTFLAEKPDEAWRAALALKRTLSTAKLPEDSPPKAI